MQWPSLFGFIAHPDLWISYLFAGLWAEVWKYGTGVGILALCGAAIVFNPLGLRQTAISVAALTALCLGAYSLGARDAAARDIVQRAIFLKQLHHDYIFTPRPQPKRSSIWPF